MLYIGVSRRSAQATAGKGLAQGPYVTARAGVEPTTLRLRVIASTNAPSRPTIVAPPSNHLLPITCQTPANHLLPITTCQLSSANHLLPLNVLRCVCLTLYL